MLTPEEIAERITAATAARRAIDPFTDTDPDLTLPTAYAAQDLVVAERVDGGHPVIGAKLGLTSRAKQRAMGVDEPLHGWLTADMVCAPGEPLDLGRWIHPASSPRSRSCSAASCRGRRRSPTCWRPRRECAPCWR